MGIPRQIALAAAALILSSTAVSQEKSTDSSAQGGTHPAQGQMRHAQMQSSPNAAKAPFDLQFIDTMSMHHQSAIDMARLADKRSSHEELKQMANKLIDDQQNEIKQLQEWKEKWYAGKGDALNMKMPGMAESMKGMRMEKLEASSGAAFDAMFIDMMIRHHRGAVKMAQDASGKAQHAEIKDLAKKIIDEQKKEITQMEKWKKEWRLASK